MENLSDDYEFVWYGGEESKRDSGGRIKYTIEAYGSDEDEVNQLKATIKHEFACKGIHGVSVVDNDTTHFDVYISL